MHTPLPTCPSAITAVSASTLSLMVPYLTVVVPLALVEAMPPSVASAPGSTGKKSPAWRRASFSCLRVTPACTLRDGAGGGGLLLL